MLDLCTYRCKNSNTFQNVLTNTKINLRVSHTFLTENLSIGHIQFIAHPWNLAFNMKMQCSKKISYSLSKSDNKRGVACDNDKSN